ncbi:fumarate/nitrate reduction transcriptional regulator Fnr [Thiomicrospira pelophila]|uniref:fumarate/nitrate reduction transcriptional regulator Fnr n=1 Tax=Thiomicrospira pelophila TaxID=934 RepID=UPI0004A76D1C|nr:fumarate/nitrate reduction transcriptional regulator Fnr [Thiomicrospira pelophila]
MGELKNAFNIGCPNCGLQKICFPTGLMRADITRLDSIVERKSPLHKGDHLYRFGESFDSVFAIKAGVVKVYNLTNQGDEQILGFYLPGDVIGLDALSTKHYQCNAVALDTTSVCAIPFDQLETLSMQIPALNHQLFCLMSKGVNDGRVHSEILSKRNADQRVAHFIWNLSHRFMNRGYLHTEFRFNVLQRDVAMYLGLTPETVSRILARLAKDKVVHWKRKEVKIFDLERLRELAGEKAYSQEIGKDLHVKMG